MIPNLDYQTYDINKLNGKAAYELDNIDITYLSLKFFHWHDEEFLMTVHTHIYQYGIVTTTFKITEHQISQMIYFLLYHDPYLEWVEY